MTLTCLSVLSEGLLIQALKVIPKQILQNATPRGVFRAILSEKLLSKGCDRKGL